MMLLLWLVVEDFWARPRPAGFGSAAAAPEQKKKCNLGPHACAFKGELDCFAVPNAAGQHAQLQEDAERSNVSINNTINTFHKTRQKYMTNTDSPPKLVIIILSLNKLSTKTQNSLCLLKQVHPGFYLPLLDILRNATYVELRMSLNCNSIRCKSLPIPRLCNAADGVSPLPRPREPRPRPPRPLPRAGGGGENAVEPSSESMAAPTASSMSKSLGWSPRSRRCALVLSIS